MAFAHRSRWVRVAVVVLVIAAWLGWRHHRDVSHAVTRAGARPELAAVSAARPLVAPARLAITVRDERGPIAKASVRLAPSEGEIVVLRTGRDGVARGTVEPGRWQISASAADHLPAALPEATVAASEERTLAIELASGGQTLRGTVSDATGGPIAGARIDAGRSATGAAGAAIATTLTAADGTYHLSVAPGTVMVAAASADYAPQARSVEVGPTGAVADFALVPGGTIEGIVRDERTSEPIGGARVRAWRSSPIQLAETGAHEAIAGPDGRFRIGGLRPGSWSLWATEGARFSKQPASVGLGVAEQVGDVELRIGAGPTIRGNVVDEAGAPAGGVEVIAFADGSRGKATADARGAFVLERLRPGAYAFTASGASFLPGAATRLALTDRDIDGVVVRVTRAATIRGHVEPRQICELQRGADERRGMAMMPPPVSSGPDGEFSLGAAADGALQLTARCASGDQGAKQIRVARGMADVVVEVSAGGSIEGHVVDGEGKPVAGAGVVASETSHGEHISFSGGVLTSGAQTVSDATGAYRIGGLAAGTYQLGALDHGAMVNASKAPRIELAAQAHETGADLVIDRANGVIAGTVTGPDGTPLPDAWVSIEQNLNAMMRANRKRDSVVTMTGGDPPPGAGYPPVVTDAQGHYEIRGLPSAIFDVLAEAQHGQLRARAVRIKPDATVDLKTTAVAVLSGTVTGPAGPAALFAVTLEGTSSALQSFTGGTFSFGRVDPGPYTLRVTAAEGSGEATLVVKPGEPATVAITLVANAIVVGVLVDPAGAPLVGVPVVLSPDHDEAHVGFMLNGPPVTTGPDGRFRLDHPAERSALLVLSQSMTSPPFTKRGLVLEPGKTLDLGVVTVTPPGPGSGAPSPGAGSGASPPRDNRAPPAPPTRDNRAPPAPPTQPDKHAPPPQLQRDNHAPAAVVSARG